MEGLGFRVKGSSKPARKSERPETCLTVSPGNPEEYQREE